MISLRPGKYPFFYSLLFFGWGIIGGLVFLFPLNPNYNDTLGFGGRFIMSCLILFIGIIVAVTTYIFTNRAFILLSNGNILLKNKFTLITIPLEDVESVHFDYKVSDPPLIIHGIGTLLLAYYLYKRN